jgi:hypothetical protein
VSESDALLQKLADGADNLIQAAADDLEKAGSTTQ